MSEGLVTAGQGFLRGRAQAVAGMAGRSNCALDTLKLTVVHPPPAITTWRCASVDRRCTKEAVHNLPQQHQLCPTGTPLESNSSKCCIRILPGRRGQPFLLWQSSIHNFDYRFERESTGKRIALGRKRAPRGRPQAAKLAMRSKRFQQML